MAIDAGILNGTHVVACAFAAEHPVRRIALVWRKGSPRETGFGLLGEALKRAA